MQRSPQVSEQVSLIRETIIRDGEAYVGREDLRVLCDEEPTAGQFTRVSAIASREGWTFKFLHDGRLRFRK